MGPITAELIAKFRPYSPRPKFAGWFGKKRGKKVSEIRRMEPRICPKFAGWIGVRNLKDEKSKNRRMEIKKNQKKRLSIGIEIIRFVLISKDLLIFINIY